MRVLSLLVVVLLVATSFAWLSWWTATSPAAYRYVPTAVPRALNLPVALYARLTNQYTGMDLWFSRDTCCFCSYEDVRNRYMVHAISVWAAIFAIPSLAAMALEAGKRDD